MTLYPVMMQLHQIQVRYVPVEDRAMLRVATREGTDKLSEFRFWVTRRYSMLLLSALGRNAVQAVGTRPETPASNRSQMLEFQRDAALADSDFKTGFVDSAKDMPLGSEPVLLARVGLNRLSNGMTVLALHPQRGKGIEVRLNDTLVHSLIKLVEDAARSGGWGLPDTFRSRAAIPSSERMN